MNISAIRLITILVIVLSNLDLSSCIWLFVSDWINRNFPGMSDNGFSTAARVLGNITSHDPLERRFFNETEIDHQLGAIGSAKPKEIFGPAIGHKTMYNSREMVENASTFLPFSSEDQRNRSSIVTVVNYTETETLPTIFSMLFNGSNVSLTAPLMLLDHRNGSDIVSPMLHYTKFKITTPRTIFDGLKHLEDIGTTRVPNIDLSSVSKKEKDVPTAVSDGYRKYKDISSTLVPPMYEDSSNYSRSFFEERSTTLPTFVNSSVDIASTQLRPLLFMDLNNDSSSVSGMLNDVEDISTNPLTLYSFQESDEISSTSPNSLYNINRGLTAVPIVDEDQNNNNWELLNSDVPVDVTASTKIPILIEQNESTVVLDLLDASTISYERFLDISEKSSSFSTGEVFLLDDENEIIVDDETTAMNKNNKLPSATDDKPVNIYELFNKNNYSSELSRTLENDLTTESVHTIFRALTESYLNSTWRPIITSDEAITRSTAPVTNHYSTISQPKTLQLEAEDPWLGYFDVVRSNDVKNCLSLMVCETSAEPNLYQEYGRRISDFFLKYIPREDNRAGWWYKNAAIMGLESKTVDSCKSHFPFCDIDTRHIFMLMEFPEY